MDPLSEILFVVLCATLNGMGDFILGHALMKNRNGLLGRRLPDPGG